MEIPEGCPDPIGQLMTNCWKFQPNQRWSFTQILQFLTEITWEEVSDVKCEEDELMSELTH